MCGKRLVCGSLLKIQEGRLNCFCLVSLVVCIILFINLFNIFLTAQDKTLHSMKECYTLRNKGVFFTVMALEEPLLVPPKHIFLSSLA